MTEETQILLGQHRPHAVAEKHHWQVVAAAQPTVQVMDVQQAALPTVVAHIAWRAEIKQAAPMAAKIWSQYV